MTTLANARGIPWETDPARIPDSEYVQVRDGHLSLKGQRVRYWGHIGHFPNPNLDNRAPGDARRDLELMVDRMGVLGFNLHRIWHEPDGDFTKGDDSRDDLRAYGLYLLKKNNIKVWFAGLNHIGLIDPEVDVNVIDDPATAEAWKEAVNAIRRKSWRWQGQEASVENMANKWDPRLRALVLARMRQRATVLNPYTGLRYCDDPNVVVWELTNEEWWMPKMVGGQWMKLPKFFQTQLIEQWNKWLAKKYQTHARLTVAWGFLFDGESLAGKSIMLAPTARPAKPAQLNDPNPHAQAALSVGDEVISRDSVTHARSADVIEFFMDMLLATKNEEAQMVKSLGKSARLSPLLYDTGTGWQIQCQYLHQNADAVTHCTYVNGKHHDRNHQRFPFASLLEEQPHLCADVPWVEHNRTPGKPYFVYETQIKTSAKYRVEFPYEMAALGSLQDWDIINWHTYGPGPDSTKPLPNVRALEVGHSMDLHFGGDEVQLSAMRAAAALFCNFAIDPAANPTWYVFGRKMLFHPASMDYAGSYGDIGPTMLPTTYRHGMRLLIDPSLDQRPQDPMFERKRQDEFGDPKDDAQRKEQLAQVHERFVRQGYLTIGPVVVPRALEPSPIQPTEQIAYHWNRGNLRMDSPAAAAFTGFYAQIEDPARGVEFPQSDVRLSDVQVVNPQDMPYPVKAGEKYIGFGLASTDGKPLKECKHAILSLVSTSFNTGFSLNTEGEIGVFSGADVGTPGDLPVLVARVSGVVHAPALDGMRYVLRDFSMKELGQGVVKDGTLVIPADKPVFLIELSR